MTPNYGREAIPERVRLGTQLVLPGGGASPAIGAVVGFGAFASGVATGTDFTWAEVGILRAVPSVFDGDYLTAGNVTGGASELIGRFIPSRFVVALNAPLFATACAAGSFTYQGQPFSYVTAPVITATAVGVSGATTTNYTGAFFKLTNATVSGRTYSSPAAALDVSGLPAAGVDPNVVPTGGGVGTLTFSSGSGLSVRQRRATSAVRGADCLVDQRAGRRRSGRGRRRSARQSRDVRLRRRHRVHVGAGDTLRPRAHRHGRRLRARRPARADARRVLRERGRGLRRERRGRLHDERHARVLGRTRKA